MGEYRPAEGDRVRVVLEGTVGEVWHSGLFRLHPDNAAAVIAVSPDRAEGFNLSVEKIEPPVEVFKEGDVVRYKYIPKYTYAIGKGGYMDLYNAVWNDKPRTVFTSKDYEKVNLG